MKRQSAKAAHEADVRSLVVSLLAATGADRRVADADDADAQLEVEARAIGGIALSLYARLQEREPLRAQGDRRVREPRRPHRRGPRSAAPAASSQAPPAGGSGPGARARYTFGAAGASTAGSVPLGWSLATRRGRGGAPPVRVRPGREGSPAGGPAREAGRRHAPGALFGRGPSPSAPRLTDTWRA